MFFVYKVEVEGQSSDTDYCGRLLSLITAFPHSVSFAISLREY